jgi:hypothetical protein
MSMWKIWDSWRKAGVGLLEGMGWFGSFPFLLRLTVAERVLLTAVANGNTLKSHRDLDGNKQYKLWSAEPEAVPQDVPFALVQRLLAKKLLTTNQKFPAATFLLTTKGKKLVASWSAGVRGVGEVVNFEG